MGKKIPRSIMSLGRLRSHCKVRDVIEKEGGGGGGGENEEEKMRRRK